MKRILSTIGCLYFFVLTVIHPLIMRNGYSDVGTVKMYFYMYSALAFLVFTILIGCLFFIINKDTRQEMIQSVKSFDIRKLGWADRFMLAFLAVVLVSTFTSKWVYESFWGIAGRWQGGYMLLLYISTYIILSRNFVPKQIYMDLFILAGLIVCGWAIMDYFGHSPIGAGKNEIFYSTIGNINFLTALVGMYLAAASIMFVGETKGTILSAVRSVYYLLSACVILVSLICGRSANALLSLAFIICFTPFYAFRNREGIVRYFILLSAYMFSMMAFSQYVLRYPESACIFPGELGQLCMRKAEIFPTLCGMFLFAAVFCYVLLHVFYKKSAAEALIKDEYGLRGADRKLSRIMRIIWAALGVLAFCGAVYVFYDANHGGHPELYAPFRSILIFDENWGTDRGFVWGITAKYYRDFSIKEKLFGTGPETFSIFIILYDLNNTIRRLDVTFDAVHNEMFQHLFEIGLAGFITFYGWASFACASGLKRIKAELNNTGAAFAFAAMTYICQSFVNIRVAMVFPIAIVCMAVAAAVGRVENE